MYLPSVRSLACRWVIALPFYVTLGSSLGGCSLSASAADSTDAKLNSLPRPQADTPEGLGAQDFVQWLRLQNLKRNDFVNTNDNELKELLTTRNSRLKLLKMKAEALEGQEHLTSFFRSLEDTIEAPLLQKQEQRTRISVFGNSLIASDNIVRVIRENFQRDFGDAGRGFLLANPQLPKAPRRRTANWSKGWSIHKLVMDDKTRYPKGIGGAVFVSSSGSAFSRYDRLLNHDRVKFFWLDHAYAKDIKLVFEHPEGNLLSRLEAKHKRELRVDTVAIPEGATKVWAKVKGHANVSYGASLEREGPGMIVDTMGIVATDASDWMKAPDETMLPSFKGLNSDLVIYLHGGNEIKKLAFGWAHLEDYARDIPLFVKRHQEALPGASCLVVGPPQNILRPPSKRAFQTRSQFFTIEKLYRDAARDAGCAYFDIYKSMGSSKAFKRLHQKGWLQPDFVHPRRKGLDLMGQLITDALYNSFNEYRSVRFQNSIQVQQVGWQERSPEWYACNRSYFSGVFRYGCEAYQQWFQEIEKVIAEKEIEESERESWASLLHSRPIDDDQ